MLALPLPGLFRFLRCHRQLTDATRHHWPLATPFAADTFFGGHLVVAVAWWWWHVVVGAWGCGGWGVCGGVRSANQLKATR
jgi:hypothetical protein